MHSVEEGDFVLHSDGTTAWDTLSVILPSFLECFTATTVYSRLITKHTKLMQFINDFFIIVIPTILKVTVLADNAILYIMVQLCLALSVFLICRNTKSTKSVNKNKGNDSSIKPFITNARSIISNITIVAILAVDFPIFPRRFAKTRSFGYSLMDVGVGLYVFANGIVAPEIKEQKLFNFYKSLKSTIPLFILGSSRFFILTEIDYHVPVSEYGLHWNFFITLAVTKILSSVILCFVKPKFSLYISLLIFLGHEILLMSGLTDWVVSDIPRNNFLNANREGISSSLGYVGLYFLSVAFGKLINVSKINSRLLTKLLLSSLILLTSTMYCEQSLGVSRRLANTGYCLWIMFIGILMTALLLGIEMILKRMYQSFNKNIPTVYSPLLFEGINYNGLVFFLLGNILTGAVNILIDTEKQSEFTSLLVITLYMLVVHGVITLLYVKKIKVKLS